MSIKLTFASAHVSTRLEQHRRFLVRANHALFNLDKHRNKNSIKGQCSEKVHYHKTPGRSQAKPATVFKVSDKFLYKEKLQ